jgi:hypothetical protein
MYFKHTRESVPLDVLNIWLDPGSTLMAVFELCKGANLVDSLRLPASVFGYPNFDKVPASGLWSASAAPLGDWLKTWQQPDGMPLWLSFGTHPDPTGAASRSSMIGATEARPSGFLPVVFWEMNLLPVLGRSVLRMQGMPVRPLTQHQTLHVAICCSFAVAKQIEPPLGVLEKVFDQLHPLAGQRLTLHVFADNELKPTLDHLAARYSSVGEVIVYDPVEAGIYGEAERMSEVPDDLSDIQNPWLLWMRDKLSRAGADAVMFISHGYVSRGHGALAIAESPLRNSDRHWARFVGTRELSMFLNQLGAWSLILASPPHNFSVAGLRILQDDLTDYVAGPIVAYELDDDPARQDFAHAFDYLFNLSEAAPPLGRSLIIYTHPDWKQPFGGAEDYPTHQLLEEFTLAGRLRDRFSSADEVPSWLAAGQRSLERSVAKISTGALESDVGRAARKGKEDALRFTANLLARYSKFNFTDL